jgi:hypothetical protein
MAYKILREIRKDLPRFCGRQIALSVNPRVAEVLLVHAHKACAELGRELGREIEIRGQPGLHQEQFEVTALDSGPPVSIPLQWLGIPPEPVEEVTSAADSQTGAEAPSSAAVADSSEPADAAADESESAPPEVEAPPEDAAKKTGQPVSEPMPEQAESAPEPVAPESTPDDEASEQPPRESISAKAASEEMPPDDESAAGRATTAGAKVAEAENSLEVSTPAVEMLDLEQETPILPPPAKVEEP